MKSLLRLKSYLKPYWPYLIGSLLLAIPLSALRFSPAPLVRRLVDDLASKDARKLTLFPLLFIGLYLLNFVVRFFHYYFLRVVIARVNQKLKNDIFQHLNGLSADYFTEQSTGTLISRVGSDPQYIDGALGCINILIREPITFLFLFGYALHLNWRLTLITLLILPPLAWVFGFTGKYLKRYISRMNEENAKLFSTLQESFTGIRVVQTFGLRKYVDQKFQEKSANFAKFLLKTAKVEEAAHPAVELLTALAIALVIYYGGFQVVEGKMTSGQLLAFFTSFAMMMNPLRLMNDVSIKLHSAASACDRIFEIFDWKTRIIEKVNPVPFPSVSKGITFDHVTFAYPDQPDRLIIQDVSFEVPKGKTIALVGQSGAGKSSLVNLLPRIFDIQKGSIQIDRIDIRDFKLEELRKNVAVVSQDVFLFNDTIRENIRCGKLGATEAEIREAARKAHALEFIETLQNGWETVIGDRGQKLSGGERQRISIARAFLRESPILILDEATSSLDSRSEKVVQEALEELMQNRTTIMIAHRLSTVRNAHEILVVQAGKVVERGTHDSLMRSGGQYAKFHQMSEGSL